MLRSLSNLTLPDSAQVLSGAADGLECLSRQGQAFLRPPYDGLRYPATQRKTRTLVPP
jgi:hypothetical protein